MKNFKEETWRLSDGEFDIFFYYWRSAEEVPLKGIVQIAHGMGEQANRYRDFARILVENGYQVYANDHRGHGETAGTRNKLGYIGENDGFKAMTANLAQLSEIIKDRHPELPLFLFAHSMGAMLGQNYITEYAKKIKGLILSGTAGKEGLRPDLHPKVKELIAQHGTNYRSEEIVTAHFGGYNDYFAPNQTDFDFMSRDLSVVDKYLADPLNGFIFPLSFYDHLYNGIAELYHAKKLESIPKELPIYLVSGSDDPVGVYGKEVKELSDMYKRLGMNDVTCDIYEGGRHEMLNETNKEEVISEIIKWLDARV